MDITHRHRHVVFRPVVILADDGLDRVTPKQAELDAFVHVNDVATAAVLALAADLHGHIRLTLCRPGQFNATAATSKLGWRAMRTWPD